MSILEIFSHKNWLLLKAMVSSDFKLRYKQSMLGYLWSVLKPLMLFGVMYVVFIHFLRFGDSVPHFSVGLLLGIVMWNFFSETTSGGLNAVVGHGDLLRKIKFSKYIVVVSAATSALINLGISFVVVMLFALANGVHFTWSALLIIPIFVELFFLALGVAFFLGAAYVYFRDLSQIWEVVMQAGFYATPIIYPVSLVVTNAGEFIARLQLLLNPAAQIVQDARHVLIAPENVTVWENWPPYIAVIPVILSFLIFLGGLKFYTAKSKSFAELV